MAGQFRLAVERRGRSLSGWLYLAVFGSGRHFAPGLEAATLRSFSSFPSSSHVCAASEQPPYSETPGEILKKKDIQQAFLVLSIKRLPRNGLWRLLKSKVPQTWLRTGLKQSQGVQNEGISCEF